MGFLLIQGTFAPDLGEPDGDSVRFIADDLSNWEKLSGKMGNLGSEDSIQLRFEGIDAIEKQAIQPLSRDARDSMFSLIGRDAAARPTGYILSKAFEQNGRPVCFVFSGNAPEADGADVFLSETRLRTSVNYQQVEAGFAYPLYYNTLFRDLREEFNVALATARAARAGYWPTDASLAGVTVNTRSDLFTIPPIWPKLWRRLESFLRTPRNLSSFIASVKASGERADDLTTFEQKSMDHFFRVTGNTVRMAIDPKDLRIVSNS
jgi:endonuclease YncB( thermonuclease family)